MKIPHYYGDIIRKIFLVCGLIILITLPFLKNNISTPIFYSVLIILVLAFFAGMTNPRQKEIIVGDVIVSVIAFLVFFYQTVTKFQGFFDLLFLTNFLLSILFLFAFYWSVKSLRGLETAEMSLSEEQIENDLKREVDLEDEDTQPKIKLTEEERRRKRFLSDE